MKQKFESKKGKFGEFGGGGGIQNIKPTNDQPMGTFIGSESEEIRTRLGQNSQGMFEVQSRKQSRPDQLKD